MQIKKSHQYQYIDNETIDSLFDNTTPIFSQKKIYIIYWDSLNKKNKERIYSKLYQILLSGKRIRIFTQDLEKSGLKQGRLEEFVIEERYNKEKEIPYLVSQILNGKDRHKIKKELDEYFEQYGIQGVKRLLLWLSEQGYNVTKTLSEFVSVSPTPNLKLLSCYISSNKPMLKQIVFPKKNNKTKEEQEQRQNLKNEYFLSNQEVERMFDEWLVWIKNEK